MQEGPDGDDPETSRPRRFRGVVPRQWIAEDRLEEHGAAGPPAPVPPRTAWSRWLFPLAWVGIGVVVGILVAAALG